MEVRLLDSADAGPIFVAVERNRASLRAWLPWVDNTSSVADVRDFIVKARAQYQENQSPQCGIWVDGEIAGCIGCHPIDWNNRHCSIGYWLEESMRGKGIITRSCAVLIDHLFGELGLHRVVIQCGTGNHKSCAVPERLGFTREGVARESEWVGDRWVDLVVWSILAEEWARRGGTPNKAGS